MRQLNEEQRKFLEYLKTQYNCLGYDISIPDALRTNTYSVNTMNNVLADWKLFRIGKFERIDTIKKLYALKKPTNYLK